MTLKYSAFTLVVGASLCVVTIAMAVVDVKDAVGVWLFDDGRGEVAKDSSRNGNDGDLLNDGGDIPQWVKGQQGQALDFDGVGSYVELGTNEDFDVDGSISIVSWVNFGGPGAGNGIIMIKQEPTGTPGASYGLVFLAATSKVGLSMETDKAAWRDYLSNDAMEFDTWTHVAGTYEPGELNVYIDGKVNAEHVADGNIDPTTGPLYIGREDAWAKEQFKGTVDEIAIFDRALSEEEVNEIMDKGLAGLLSVSPSGKMSTTWADVKTRFR